MQTVNTVPGIKLLIIDLIWSESSNGCRLWKTLSTKIDSSIAAVYQLRFFINRSRNMAVWWTRLPLLVPISLTTRPHSLLWFGNKGFCYWPAFIVFTWSSGIYKIFCDFDHDSFYVFLLLRTVNCPIALKRDHKYLQMHQTNTVLKLHQYKEQGNFALLSFMLNAIRGYKTVY